MSLFWFIGFPILFILLFGIIFTLSEHTETKYDIGITINGKDKIASLIKEGLESRSFFVVHTGSLDDELKALEKEERLLVIEIPEEGSVVKDNKTKPPEIIFYYDKNKSTTALLCISAVREILSNIENKVKKNKSIFTTKAILISTQKVSLMDYFLPGVLALAISQLGLFGALNFVSLRERKIIRRLGVTPVPRGYIVWSGIIARLFISVFQTLTIIFLGSVLFGVTVKGNYASVIGIVILGVLVFTSIGYLLSIFAKSIESAQGLFQLVQAPMIFFSGIFFPLELMYKVFPPYLQFIVKIIPLSYLGDALRYILVRIPSTFGLWIDIGVLAGWLIVSSIITIIFFRWE